MNREHISVSARSAVDCRFCLARIAEGLSVVPDCPHRYSVSVAAVVTDPADRVLVIRRADNGAWEIPGGILELAESIPEGLVRETFEETGLLVEPSRLTGVYKHPHRAVVCLVFRARVVRGVPCLSEETTAVRWWPVTMVTARMSKPMATRVLDALHAPEPVVRLVEPAPVLSERLVLRA